MACAAAVLAAAAIPPGCADSATLGTIGILVGPFSPGKPLELKEVAEIPGGSRLIWDPVHLAPQVSKKAEVSAVLVPSSSYTDLITLEPRKAHQRAEWQLPERPHVIAMILGLDGLSEGKVKSLVTHNPDLLRQLAAYAEQSSRVESLVQQLADAEQQGGSANAVLKGFSSQYGVAMPAVDTRAPSSQQASSLLQALMPTAGTYDPLAAGPAQVQQTGGLAAAMAGMFFGNPVALAAGGASLFENLKTALFPSTVFRSAFAQADPEGLALCTKSVAPQAKMRSAFLWAYKVPEFHRPQVSLAGTPHIPLGAKSKLRIKLGGGATLRDVAFARDWRFAPAGGGASIPVAVQFEAADSMTVDLSKAKVSAGAYQLAATWDWDPITADGTVDVRPYGDFSHVTLGPGQPDKLIEGSGKVAVKLTGADFEFLQKAAIQGADEDSKPSDVKFKLPLGEDAGPQDSVGVTIDTAQHGSYQLLLTQSDGVTHTIPLTVLTPNPKISNLPVRLNEGEPREAIHLRGSGMDRIEGVFSEAGVVTGAADANGWSGEVVLKNGLAQGQHFALSLKVQGLEKPVSVPEAVAVVGPRPKIRSVQKSLSDDLGVSIAADELPAGIPAGLVLNVDHLDEGGLPNVHLGCQGGGLRQALTISTGELASGASLTSAGPGALYLSVDPGQVGYSGCRLTATVTVEPEGHSDAYVLGRVVRVPHLEKFTLSDEKVGDSSYAGSLEGTDLDVIEKIGWDAEHGVPVVAIPTPEAAHPQKQRLQVVLPWPAPGPHAPVYVWLRGEATGRKGSVTY